jgi:hypothetical protein
MHKTIVVAVVALALAAAAAPALAAGRCGEHPWCNTALPADTRADLLRGAHRVELGPGESARVRFPLSTRALAYWNTDADGWRIARGCYRVAVGASSRDLPLRGVYAVRGARCGARAVTFDGQAA